MGLFDDEYNQQVGESRFDQLKLDELFPSPEEKQQLHDVITVLNQTASDNLAMLKIQELGEKGLEVLIKVAKKVLL